MFDCSCDRSLVQTTMLITYNFKLFLIIKKKKKTKPEKKELGQTILFPMLCNRSLDVVIEWKTNEKFNSMIRLIGFKRFIHVVID